MKKVASKRLASAEVAAAIVKDIDAWLELKRLADQFSAERLQVELKTKAGSRPPIRSLLDVTENEPNPSLNLSAYVESVVGRAAEQYFQQTIRKSAAYQWLSDQAGFEEIEEWAGHPIGKSVPTQGKRAENTVKFLQVITPIVIRWAILKDGKALNRIGRVSLTKKDMRLVRFKAEELVELLDGVIQTQSRNADRLYSFMDPESVQPCSIRLVNILRGAALEWREQERLSQRVVREDETTLDRQLIGELSSSLYDAFERGTGRAGLGEAKSPKIAGSLALILGINLHRSSIGEAAKLRGKGSD